jgi:hypothetical protein
MRPKETTFFVWGRGSKGHFISGKKYLRAFLKRAQLNLFGKYAVTKKLSSSEGTMISYVYTST